MYEKDFPQTNATIATLQVYQLVFSYLSVAIRAFSIIKKACGFEHFFVFLQPTGKLPADST